ncbi:hypothetical protein Ari01nite_90220 [Paractinoplanes rishiriensis]|uniref:Tyr recombinase domain-containing protein n=1 Tax=Paractinoplanes rishiriensis TaxID=1050105 RepID=A0A919N2R8_9ACTN|nr:hypothetical protein Ari01nite_90220 [Actinoplanes rishiriensis]
MHLLGVGFVYKSLPPEAVAAMFTTAYIVLRDTGRRPREVCGLRLDCIEHTSGEYNLIWDNHKGRRLRRRLPITAATAEAVLAWREQRLALPVPSRSTPYLFPAITNNSGGAPLSSGTQQVRNDQLRRVDPVSRTASTGSVNSPYADGASGSGASRTASRSRRKPARKHPTSSNRDVTCCVLCGGCISKQQKITSNVWPRLTTRSARSKS